MDDDCQYMYQGSLGWIKHVYCRTYIGPGTYDYFMGNTKLWRVDDSDPSVHAVYYYISAIWVGESTQTGERLVLTDTGWITQAALAQQQQVVATSEPDTSSAATQMVSREEALATIQEFKIRLGSIWTQPDCNHSYNGCF